MEDNMINMVIENDTNEPSGDANEIKRDMAPHRRVSIRICKQCGHAWILSDNDAIYYLNEFGTLPLRCGDCRAKNREKNRKTNIDKEND